MSYVFVDYQKVSRWCLGWIMHFTYCNWSWACYRTNTWHYAHVSLILILDLHAGLHLKFAYCSKFLWYESCTSTSLVTWCFISCSLVRTLVVYKVMPEAHSDFIMHGFIQDKGFMKSSWPMIYGSESCRYWCCFQLSHTPTVRKSWSSYERRYIWMWYFGDVFMKENYTTCEW
jgi:hypothetical protein